MSTDKTGDRDGSGTGVVTRTRTRTKKPSMYKVLLLNDDYTPMEFVVEILERFFGKGREEAMRIMLHVHQRGVGVCGVFTYEVAETKVNKVMEYARRNQHPLHVVQQHPRLRPERMRPAVDHHLPLRSSPMPAVRHGVQRL